MKLSYGFPVRFETPAGTLLELWWIGQLQVARLTNGSAGKSRLWRNSGLGPLKGGSGSTGPL